MKFEHLIVDSSGFIHNGPIRETGNNVYSCQDVIDEIKDLATLERLRVLPYELKLIQFDQDDLDFCIEFSKKTGDYKQLSIVDLKLIASTYRLEKRYNGQKFINNEPKNCDVVSMVKPNNAPSVFDRIVDKLNIRLTSSTLNDSSAPISDADLDQIMEDEAAIVNDEEGSDEEGWITPQNIHKLYEKPKVETAQPMLDGRITVACMTSDFSIQNCLLQMGLLVVGPKDGLIIKDAKRIALRCHACFKVFHDLTRIKRNFCPHCGNGDTLKRVQYSVDKDGSKKVLVNFRRPIKVKGNNQQLPRPRGGKHSKNPVLTADQKVRRDKQNKFIVDEHKIVTSDHILNDPAYLVRSNPFTYRNEGNRRKRR